MNFLTALILMIAGYLIGSVPFALVIGKLFYHKDVRQYGSGNLGGTNAGRVLGLKAGFFVILLDGLKATIPMLLLNKYLGLDYALLYGLMVPIGHCWPVFTHFSGGKAVACSFGFVLAIALLSWKNFIFFTIIPIVLMLLILHFTKYVSLGSCTVPGYIVLASFFLCPLKVSLSFILLWALILIKHIPNIKRLKEGTERKVSWI